MSFWRWWLQNYLEFQPVSRYFKKLANSDHILVWKSKGLSDKTIKPCSTSNNNFVPALNNINIKTRVKSDKICLMQDKVTFTQKKRVNIHVVYEINLCPVNVGKDFTLGNSFFGSIKLTKIMTLISINILVMLLVLMHVEVFRYWMVVGLENMS